MTSLLFIQLWSKDRSIYRGKVSFISHSLTNSSSSSSSPWTCRQQSAKKDLLKHRCLIYSSIDLSTVYITFVWPDQTVYIPELSMSGHVWEHILTKMKKSEVAHAGTYRGICLNIAYRSLCSLVAHTWDLRRPVTCLCQPPPPRQLALVDSPMLVQQLGTVSLLVCRTLI